MSTYVPIQAITLTSAVASVTFTGIPQTFTDLVLVNSGTFDTSENGFALTFNSDTGSNYSTTYLYGNGTSALSLTVSNFSSINAGRLSTSFGVGITHIFNYTNRTTNKTVLSRGSSSSIVNANVGLWRGAGTPAITSLTATVPAGINNFAIGSTFTLYGIGSGAPKAFGGDRVVTDGTYWYHAFTSSGRFEPVQNLSCDILVVAGGGGGGYAYAGAGGAGGLLNFTAQSLTNQSYTVTVGAGGAGKTTAGGTGTVGEDSRFGSLTLVKGGGGGGSDGTQNAGNGGSGGGAGRYTLGGNATGGTSTSGQGNAGGNWIVGTGTNMGAGGGGAGAAGSNSGAQGAGRGGNGGNGSSSFSSWGSATGLGQNISGTYWFAGGGGGGAWQNEVAGGTGGNGGGGNGGYGVSGANGTASTGGGGGGGGGNTSFNGGNGGSGIVIVRYSV